MFLLIKYFNREVNIIKQFAINNVHNNNVIDELSSRKPDKQLHKLTLYSKQSLLIINCVKKNKGPLNK